MKCCSGSIDLNFSVSPGGDHRKLLLQLRIVLVLGVFAFFVDLEEAIEFRHAAGRAEQVNRFVLARRFHVDGGLIEHRRRHLRRDEAHPDQPVQLQQIFIEKRQRGSPASSWRTWDAPLRAHPARLSYLYIRSVFQARNRRRSDPRIMDRTSSIASLETRTESVRM